MDLRRLTIAFAFGLGLAGGLQAEVERFEIKTRVPFAGGQVFGDVGVYDRLEGTVHFTLDPTARQNKNITDLQYAPRDKDGLVHYSADLSMLVPRDLEKASGMLLYDVNNRGNKGALGFFNFGTRSDRNDPTTEAHAGDGFLMRQGIVVVWSGWIGELVPGNRRLRLRPPTTSAAGKPLVGPVRYELFTGTKATTLQVNGSGHGTYEPINSAMPAATLTHRQKPGDARVRVPREKWSATRDPSTDDVRLEKMTVTLEEGFLPGELYELIYQARNPVVMGTGLTSVRDLMSALRYGDGKDNPLLRKGMSVIQRTHGFGVSQSGRFLRELVYWGLNEDEQGRQAFSGVIPHVSGAGLGSFNYRFCQPTAYNTQFRQHDYPSDRFPFAYGLQQDSLSGRQDGVLKRCRPAVMPHIFHTQSSSEYWHRSGSLAHTDTLGKKDMPVPANVRIYIFGGTQHGPSEFPPGKSETANPQNPGDFRYFMRALLLRLDRWVAADTEPPASVYPTIASGNLVAPTQVATGFPQLPGVMFPQVYQQPSLWNIGSRWQDHRIVDTEPPIPLADYAILVPRCNVDGNERGCLNPPEVEFPVASYTGWNLIRSDTRSAGNLAGLRGSYIPFARSKEVRLANQDPRRSVQERYQSVEAYLGQMKHYCEELVEKGYLLPRDVSRILEIQGERVTSLFESEPALKQGAP